jgi:hypothetical protein
VGGCWLVGWLVDDSGHVGAVRECYGSEEVSGNVAAEKRASLSHLG